MQYVLTPNPPFSCHSSHYSFRTNLSFCIEEKIMDICVKVSKLPRTSVEE